MKASVRISYDKKDFEIPLGDGPVQIADGFGGWTTLDRPRDVALTRWAGQAPLRITVPLLLDGFADDRGVQHDLDKLLKLGRSEDGDEEPPVFRVSGPIPYSGKRWVLESTPEMGQTIRSNDGRLIRQALTLSLLQYVRPDQIKIKKRKHGDDRTYTTRKGDTLVSIAAKLRPHDSGAERIKYAKDLGERNEIRDIRRKLDAGKVLRLP